MNNIKLKKACALMLLGGMTFSLVGCGTKKVEQEPSTKTVLTDQVKDADFYRNFIEENLVYIDDDQVQETEAPIVIVEDPIDQNEYVYIEDTPEESYVNNEDFNAIVNQDVYLNLVEARNKFDSLFANGEVSVQMENRGASLNSDESGYINDSMHHIYNLICNYVNAYDSADMNTCYEAGKTLFENANNISRDYLFNILVSRKLPEGYQGPVQKENGAYKYDSFGNILLENGNTIHYIGAEDILGNSYVDYQDDLYQGNYQKSAWLKQVPNIILDQYSVINTSYEDGSNTCYFWNESQVERTCDKEWIKIKDEGKDVYGFDPSDTKITWYTENGSHTYVFEDYDENIYGPLDYDQNVSVDRIYTVQDALYGGTGDAYLLDSYVKDMTAHVYGTQYNK